MKPQVMVISASSGSGHTRAAEAIYNVCADHPDIGHVIHVDALAYTNELFRKFYAKLYIQVVKNAPRLWGWFYEKSDEPWRTDLMRISLDRLNMQPLVNLIREVQPALTICTHFLPAEIITYLLNKEKIKTRFNIVVTDYYVHAMWLSRALPNYFVAHEESKIHLQMLGFPEDKITVSGIPIDPLFTHKYDKKQLRHKYGLSNDLPVLLLSAGSSGITPAAEVVNALRFLATPAQIVVICGQNAKLLKKVQAIVHNFDNKSLSFRVLGYTDKMHEWMALADLFIGKPGGLTTAEAMASHLPMAIYAPIPGQEEHNSDHLLESGAAIKCSELLTIPFKIDCLLQNRSRLTAMRAAAERIAHPNAAHAIVKSLLKQLK